MLLKVAHISGADVRWESSSWRIRHHKEITVDRERPINNNNSTKFEHSVIRKWRAYCKVGRSKLESAMKQIKSW